MRAILRIGFSMAAATNPLSRNLVGPTHRLTNLVQQLRLYKPPSDSSGGGDDDDVDVDERGKIFSHMGMAESATTPRPDRLSLKRAAVLVCLFENDDPGDLRVILTKRSSSLSSHSGEVSLPGGKAEEGDADDKETAVREAQEEIGLDPSNVNVVTVLEPFLSKHLLRVVPVIGILTDRRAFVPVVNSNEVDAIFDAPLEMFLMDENRRSEERDWLGSRLTIHYFDYEAGGKKFMIWGLTASILIRAASVVFQRPPDFPEQPRKFHSYRIGSRS